MDNFLYCTNCGKKVPHEAVFCIHCGSKIEKPINETSANSMPENDTSGAVDEKQEDHKKKSASSTLLKKHTQNRVIKNQSINERKVNPDIVTIKAKPDEEDNVFIPPVLTGKDDDEVYEVKRRELVTSKSSKLKIEMGADPDEYDFYYENVDPIDKGNEYNPFEKNKKTIMLAILSLLIFFSVGIGVILYVLKDF